MSEENKNTPVDPKAKMLEALAKNKRAATAAKQVDQVVVQRLVLAKLEGCAKDAPP
jgi:hypothetical protein